MIGVFRQSDFWEDEMLQGLVRFLMGFTETPDLRGFVVDEMGKFFNILANNVIDRVVAVFSPPLGIHVIADVLRKISTMYFHGVGPAVAWTG